MRNYHLRRNTKWCPTLNLDKLWTLVSEQTRLKHKDAKSSAKVPVIDLVKAVSVITFLLVSYFNHRNKFMCQYLDVKTSLTVGFVFRDTINSWEKGVYQSSLLSLRPNFSANWRRTRSRLLAVPVFCVRKYWVSVSNIFLFR